MLDSEFNPCKLKKPEILAIGPETERTASCWAEVNKKNSGVLLISVKGLGCHSTRGDQLCQHKELEL